MDKNQPLVSILIPNYNKASYLRETLDSIISQTYSNWECIVVDDHSTDISMEILEEYSVKDSRFKIYKRPNYLLKGGNAARNYAFELSKGEFVNWFDSDDLMNGLFISSKIEVLIVDPELNFVISNLITFESYKTEISPYNSLDLSQKGINYPLEALKGNFWIGSPVPMFRRKFLERIKLFDEKLIRGQEAEFFNRVLLQNPSFEFVENSILYWRLHDNSKTSEFKYSSNSKKSTFTFPAHFLILNEYLNNKPLDEDSIKFFNKLLNKHLRYLPIFSSSYFKLLRFIYFKYKQFPKDYPIKILTRRILKIEDWK